MTLSDNLGSTKGDVVLAAGLSGRGLGVCGRIDRRREQPSRQGRASEAACRVGWAEGWCRPRRKCLGQAGSGPSRL